LPHTTSGAMIRKGSTVKTDMALVLLCPLGSVVPVHWRSLVWWRGFACLGM
jgi:hypothetical protein